MYDTGPFWGLRCDEAPFECLWIARMLADHAWRTIIWADEIKLIEMNEMSVKNGGMKFEAGENGRKSTAVEQAVLCAPFTQRARVRSPVVRGFLDEVFSGFFLTCKSNVRKL